MDEALAELAWYHRWDPEVVIECILYLLPVGRRLSADSIIDVMRSVNVKVNDSATFQLLDKLERRGAICAVDPVEVDSGRLRPIRRGGIEYYLARDRHEHLRAAMSEGSGIDRVAHPVAYSAHRKAGGRWVRVFIRSLLVAIATGIGSKVGGWIGAVVVFLTTAVLAAAIGEGVVGADGSDGPL